MIWLFVAVLAICLTSIAYDEWRKYLRVRRVTRRRAR